MTKSAMDLLPCLFKGMAITLLWWPLTTVAHISSFRKIFDNFHTVQSGKIYRSKQLSSKNLNSYIQKLGIKSIVNLRGENIDKRWWQQEKAIADKNHVWFFNIAMSAKTKPTVRNLKKLLKSYQKAPQPMLIHCYSGVDRTGEAAALWVLTQQNKDKRTALKHLSVKYGYLKWIHPQKKNFVKYFAQNLA